MTNTVELQATDLFEELDDAELVAVCGGVSASVEVQVPTLDEFGQSAIDVIQPSNLLTRG